MSAESAKQAQAKSGANVFIGNILDAQFPPETFDVITCFDVFEHLYEPRRVMAKVAEWLKLGGIFYILVPNVDSAEGRVFGTYWHGLELPRHLFHYSPSSLKFLAESAGLQVVSLETWRNPRPWAPACVMYGMIFFARSARAERRKRTEARRVSPGDWRASSFASRSCARSLRWRLWWECGESIHAIFRKDASSSGVVS